MFFLNDTNNPHKEYAVTVLLPRLHCICKISPDLKNKYLHHTKCSKNVLFDLKIDCRNYVKKSTLAIGIFLQILNRLPFPPPPFLLWLLHSRNYTDHPKTADLFLIHNINTFLTHS